MILKESKARKGKIPCDTGHCCFTVVERKGVSWTEMVKKRRKESHFEERINILKRQKHTLMVDSMNFFLKKKLYRLMLLSLFSFILAPSFRFSIWWNQNCQDL